MSSAILDPIIDSANLIERGSGLRRGRFALKWGAKAISTRSGPSLIVLTRANFRPSSPVTAVNSAECAAHIHFGTADAIHPTKYHWHIREQDEPKRFLGLLSRSFNDDLFQACHQSWKRGPKFLSYGRWYDVSTAAVSADDPRLPFIPEPWRSSRLWLYPMIAGLFLAHDPRR